MKVKAPELKAPFPWFGGKSRAAHLIWEAFGDVPNYVEPFAGSLAVMLGRPLEHQRENGNWPIETVNDADCYLSNFWRSVTEDPIEVARWADWPVNEADLHARHRWLVGQAEFREKMHRDPMFYDARIAGWWVSGICQWIGGGYCSIGGLPNGENPSEQRKVPRARGIGVDSSQRPSLGTMGINRRTRNMSNSSEWLKRPSLGKGKSRAVRSQQIPHLSGSRSAAGRGIHASGLPQKIPLLSGGAGHGVGVHNRGVKYGPIQTIMTTLQARLRKVRVCCGNWSRVLGPSATTKIGVTGVVLDPPYGASAGRDPSLYAQESLDVAALARDWAVANGDNPLFRIALCGFEGEHQMPANWQVVAWKSNGGYASAAGNKANAKRERIWFSPHCLKAERQRQLFNLAEVMP